jgi:cellulose synthase (UDP-forming)
LIVICDADTRLFPNFLESTMGYFRDASVSWVQTPQWFYDVPEGVLASRIAKAKWGARVGRLVARVEASIGPLRWGRDPLRNDARPFYDVLLRRRNAANAVFCCGAASIHRREAVMRSAVRRYGRSLKRRAGQLVDGHDGSMGASSNRAVANRGVALSRAFASVEFMPYQFHVSEDIYTSLLQHADTQRRWRSVYHPEVLSKMLSPQDLHAWLIQQFKYAGGTLHMARTANPLTLPGLTLRQRLAYSTTVWSYLAGTWNLVLLLAPVAYLMTAVSPVISYEQAFVWHIAPFLIANQLAIMLLFWGIPAFAGASNHLSNFSLSLRALWAVATNQRIDFPVTPKSGASRWGWTLAWPQLSMVVLSVAALCVALARVATCAGHGASTTTARSAPIRAPQWPGSATPSARCSP